MPEEKLPIANLEAPLHHAQVELATSKRLRINARTWHHDLQSPFWRLYVYNKAGAFIHVGGQRFAFAANRIYLIPPGLRYQSSATGSMVHDFLHFYVSGLRPTILRHYFDRPVLLPHDHLLEKLCERWRRDLGPDQNLVQLCWAAALADAAVGMVFGTLPESVRHACFDLGMESSIIRPALECIDKRLANPATNWELARLCHLSTDHFARQFNRIVGMTPARYGQERRITIAAQWLKSGTRSIDEIAEGCGFTDRFHFSRIFKARLGVPPAAYRRLHAVAIRET